MTAKKGSVMERHEHKLFHLLWKAAAKEGEKRIEMESESQAIRMRFALYNSARPVREGKLIDPELLEAIKNCTVTTEGKTLIVRAWRGDKAFQLIAAGMGISLDDVEGMEKVVKSQEELQAEESAGRLFAALAGEGLVGGSGGQVSADRPRLDYRGLKKGG